MKITNTISSTYLAEAIVEQAAYDYLLIKKDLYKIDCNAFERKVKNIELTKRKMRLELQDIIRFFESDWYQGLTSLGHERLISKLDKRFEEWKQEFNKLRETGT